MVILEPGGRGTQLTLVICADWGHRRCIITHACSCRLLRSRDEALYLNFRFPTLEAGSSVGFSWGYMLNMADLTSAMHAMSVVSIAQPTSVASGIAAVFSALVQGTVSKVDFYITNSSMVGPCSLLLA
jgi:hypothetical protein